MANARESLEKAGRGAFQKVLETFFGGSLEEALAAHLLSRKDRVSDEERDRLAAKVPLGKRDLHAVTERHNERRLRE